MNVNQVNVTQDQRTYGKWSLFNQEYFANPKIMSEFCEFVKQALKSTSGEINMLDLGSADGVLGEFVAKELRKNREVSLTLLDIVPEHLSANSNPATKKIAMSVLDWEETDKYDLIIVRSLLHYFPKSDQLKIIKKIKQALTKTGVAVVAAFIQKPQSVKLFLELNKTIGKKLQLMNVAELEELFEIAKAKFTFLGNATTWACSSENLKARYNLSKKELDALKDKISKEPGFEEKEFTIKGDKFTVPVPFKIYLLKK